MLDDFCYFLVVIVVVVGGGCAGAAGASDDVCICVSERVLERKFSFL